MVRERPLPDSGQEVDSNSNGGLLFRIAARIAVVVFAGVLALSLANGMDPSLALLRALAVLLGVTACGWLAEQAVRSQPAPPEAAEPLDVAPPTAAEAAEQVEDVEEGPKAA